MKHNLSKMLSLLLCVSLMVSLFCSCSKKEDDPDTTPEQSGGEASDTNNEGAFGASGEISAYDTANSNYILTVDAANEVHEISDLLFGILSRTSTLQQTAGCMRS